MDLDLPGESGKTSISRIQFAEMTSAEEMEFHDILRAKAAQGFDVTTYMDYNMDIRKDKLVIEWRPLTH